MRKAVFIFLLSLTVVAFAHSQDWDNPEVLQRLGLDEAELDSIRGIFEETEKGIREARLEIDVLRAQLRKLLYVEQVDMREVERLVRQSLEWELKERMAQIRRQVELRKLLGDTKVCPPDRCRRKKGSGLQEEQERRVREEQQRAERERR